MERRWNYATNGSNSLLAPAGCPLLYWQVAPPGSTSITQVEPGYFFYLNLPVGEGGGEDGGGAGGFERFGHLRESGTGGHHVVDD